MWIRDIDGDWINMDRAECIHISHNCSDHRFRGHTVVEVEINGNLYTIWCCMRIGNDIDSVTAAAEAFIDSLMLKFDRNI